MFSCLQALLFEGAGKPNRKTTRMATDFACTQSPDVGTVERSNSAVTYLEYRSKPYLFTPNGKPRIFITHFHWTDPCGHRSTVSRRTACIGAMHVPHWGDVMND